MFEGLRSRLILIFGVLLFSAYIFAPNFFDKETVPDWLPDSQLVYGLDIQGGLHLVMGVDSQGVLEEKLDRLGGALKEDINKENPGGVSSSKFSAENDGSLTLSGDVSQITKYIEKYYPGILQNIGQDEGSVTYQYYDIYENQVKKQVVDQAIEVIRNRIDAFGVSEPNIAAQGDKRIVVQLPGLEAADYESAKDLINRAARLEFMIVTNEVPAAELTKLVEEAETLGNYTLGAGKEGGLKYAAYIKRLNKDLKDKLPEATELVFQKVKSVKDITDGKIPFLLKTDKVFSGDKISDAFIGRNEFGSPKVDFVVASEGRNLFADITGSNIEKQLAIVLDKVLKTAPGISSKIRERGEIRLGTGADIEAEAKFIATTLRAGALPAALEQLEERTVGPTLGADSIAAGKKAGLIGLILVLVFMISWYRGAGLVASFALCINIFLILAILSSLGATLTLPGIAGIVLTVGMAVDANVIIFERIREELLKGSGLSSAVRDGFGHAFSAIFDANITTAAVCFVLMYYGSGPIKGFAVTLIWGIATSMFTAIFVSRTFIDLSIQKFGVKTIVPLKKNSAA